MIRRKDGEPEGGGRDAPISKLAFGAVGGLLVAVLLVTVGVGSSPFTESAGYRLWVVLIGAQGLSWTLVAHAGLQARRQLPGLPRLSWTAAFAILALTVGVTAAGIVATLTGNPNLAPSLPFQQARMAPLYVAAVVAAAPALTTIWRSYRLLGSFALPFGSDPEERVDMAVSQLILFRRSLHRSLAAVGVLVALATLSAGQLRNARIAIEPALEGQWPPATVVLFGAGFTGMLAAFYLPARGRLDAKCSALVDELLPLHAPTPSRAWQQRLDDRLKFQQMLSSGDTAVQDLRNVALIGSPLAASGLALILGIA